MLRRSIFILLIFTGLLAPATERQKNSDYRDRRVALSKLMQAGGTLVLFAPLEAEGQNDLYGFRQEDNFYYLTGWVEPGAAILISAGGGSTPYTEILFLPEHNATQEKWTGPKLGPENPDAPKLTGFDQVMPLDRMHGMLLKFLPQPRATVYTDLGQDGQTAASTGPMEWLRRGNSFPNYISFQASAPLIAHLRTVKDAAEIAFVQHATDASMEGHRAALKAIHPGVNEREISALMQYEFGRRGCERPAYAPIVGSGFYSTVLHYSDDSQIMKSGDVVVMDVGGEYSMYATDITRTAPVTGKFSPRQREIYDIVLGAQEAAIHAFQAGKSAIGRDSADSLYKVAFDYINTHGKDSHGEPLGKYFIHGLGHHVGLNVHDANDYSMPLDRGMIFTLEPGIYIPEEKLGIRIEDMFTVDKDGKLVMMTRGLARTADEIEKAMAK